MSCTISEGLNINDFNLNEEITNSLSTHQVLLILPASGCTFKYECYDNSILEIPHNYSKCLNMSIHSGYHYLNYCKQILQNLPSSVKINL